MNVVSFFAPRPDHPLYRDYLPFLSVLDESCRKFGHKHIVITDADKIGDFATFHAEMPDNLMRAILAGQLAYLRSDLAKEDTILLGADCVLANDPAEIFERDFDVAFTTHPFHDCILNTGTIFVRGGSDAAKIWDLALKICGEEWGDDQIALRNSVNATLKHGTYHRLGLTVEFLPVDPWNLAPDHPGHDCSSAKILHFRGPRKDWMRDYCAHRLGIGTPVEAIALPNADSAAILENIRINSLRDLSWVHGVEPHEGHAVLVGGGPSLADTFEEIQRRASDGQVVFALNNAANWLAEHGLLPDWQMVLDSRPENLRFVKPGNSKAHLFASLVDPSLFDVVDDATLFHCFVDDIGTALPEHRQTTLVGGGITSGLTAMVVAYTLGYRKIHLYGYDSSDRNDKAHPYEQTENSAEQKRLTVWLGAQEFTAGFAMYKQAEAFPAVAQRLADEGCIITVHGDGLLPAVARSMSTATAIQTNE